MRRKVFISLITFMVILFIGGYLNISRAASSDTTLKSLTIEPSGSGLVKDTENNGIYRVRVDNNVTSVKVNAIPNSSSATVSIEGNDNLAVGTNKVTVNVTAENGEISSYTIYVRRATQSIAEQTVIPNVQEEYKEPENIISNNAQQVNITTNNDRINETPENIISQNDLVEPKKPNSVENQTLNEVTDTKEEEENNKLEEESKTIFIIVIVIIIMLILIMILLKPKNKRKH